jgi:hypothetical protein
LISIKIGVEDEIPGSGLCTNTGTYPFCELKMEPLAVRRVGDTYVVRRGVPASETLDPRTNPLPLITNVKGPVRTRNGCTLASSGNGFSNVTVTPAEVVPLSACWAVRVTVFGSGKVAGGVYRPFAAINPTAAFPPRTPFTSQTIPVLLLPVTRAVKSL